MNTGLIKAARIGLLKCQCAKDTGPIPASYWATVTNGHADMGPIMASSIHQSALVHF